MKVAEDFKESGNNEQVSKEHDSEMSEQEKEDVKEQAEQTESTEGQEEKPVEAKDAKIAELEKKLADAEDQLLRTRAEFANYKRRTTEETIRLGTYTTCQVVEKFLKVLDNFERAEAALTESTEQALVDGLQKIRKQFEETLKKLDVEEIKALNEKFDPNLHEAVMRGENPEMEEDTIDQVFEKGYKIRENVIRHSKVRVISK
ncbi:MAG: nucleotide exchange factor GrpE [Acidaminococcaceae bacterium]|nr:nucleotide exchange factor GrpE [Acidaminococcaceae bacterium]